MGINEVVQIGKRIKEYRKSKGFTQKELALRANIPYSTYSNYENNNREPNREQLQKIATALNVPLYELMGFDDSIRVKGDKQRPFDIAIQKFQNKECLSYEEEDIITEYVESERFKQEKDDIKQIAQKAYNYISFMHSHSYASSAEEFDKLQNAKRIDFEQKRSSSIHKYDAVVEITPEAIERLKEDAEAREILKKYESGEKILESEYKKVIEYHNRMMERSKLLQDWLEWYKNTCEPLNNEGRKKVAEYAETLAETDKYTKPDEWFKGRPTKEEIDKAVKTYLNDYSTDEPPQE